MTPTDVGRSLLERAAALVAIPSPSHEERAIADVVEAALAAQPHLAVVRVGDNVVATTALGRPRRLVLAGHLDTVPPEGNAHPRVADGTLTGRGATDMKGGLAVLLELAETQPEPAVDVTWCFYACEEVAHRFSGLEQLREERPELLTGDAAVLLEPTGGVVEAGCQGTVRVRLELAGAAAHTARPFVGRNAVHRLAPVLSSLAGYEGRRPVIDGCQFAEQMQAVAVEGGAGANVVPARASLVVNHRFAPDRSVEEAVDAVRGVVGDLEEGDSLEVTDAHPGAPPSLESPLLAELVRAVGAPPRAKVGWTDVATFWAQGVPAANFGPGDPLAAHTPHERVTADELAHAFEVLAQVLRHG